MTATTVTPIAPAFDQGIVGRASTAIHDTLAVARRNLIGYRRVPQLLVFSTIQPIVFVLMFRYVFGGAIQVPGVPYVDFLMPGVFAQTVVFGSMGTAIGLATDLKLGLIERFRSLPMARSAVLAGRTLADLVQSVLGLTVMLTVGVLVGFRPQGSPLNWLAAIGLMLFCGFTFSWLGVLLGLVATTSENVQAIGFVAIFPLTFASSAFVPTSTMPRFLRYFAENQPVTLIVNAVRSLLLDQPFGRDGWLALVWLVGILVVFAPISVSIYRKKTVR